MPPSPSVAGLVDDFLVRTNTTRPALADALNTSRATLWRKLSDMHTIDVGFLQRLAEATDISYPSLVRAALLDTGTITTISELVDGLPLTAVVTVDTDGPSEITAAAVFTSRTAADDYVEVAQEINTTYGRTVGQCVVTAVDPSQESLGYCTIYTAHWDNQSGVVSVTPRRTASRPAEFAADGLAATFTITTASSPADGVENLIVAVSLTGSDPSAARDTLTGRISELASEGQLAPQTFNPYPGGFMDRVADLAATRIHHPPNQAETRSTSEAIPAPSSKLVATANKLSAIPYRWGGLDTSRDHGAGPRGAFRVSRRIVNETRQIGPRHPRS